LLVDKICFSDCASFFKLIQDEQSIDEVVVSMEGGPYQEYFYIELPVSAGSSGSGATNAGNDGADTLNLQSGPRHRRFVYVQEESARKFPMQFGLEVCDVHSFIATQLFLFFN
jgi:hypothetical protein